MKRQQTSSEVSATSVSSVDFVSNNSMSTFNGSSYIVPDSSHLSKIPVHLTDTKSKKNFFSITISTYNRLSALQNKITPEFLDTTEFDKINDTLISKFILFNFFTCPQTNANNTNLAEFEALINTTIQEGSIKELFAAIYIAKLTLGSSKLEFLNNAENILLKKSLELFARDKLTSMLSKNYQQKLADLHFGLNFLLRSKVLLKQDNLIQRCQREVNKLEQEIINSNIPNFQNHKSEFKSIISELNSKVFSTDSQTHNLLQTIQKQLRQARHALQSSEAELSRIEQDELARCCEMSSQIGLSKLQQISIRVKEQDPESLRQLVCDLKESNRKLMMSKSKGDLVRSELSESLSREKVLEQKLRKEKSKRSGFMALLKEEFEIEQLEKQQEYELEREKLLRKWSQAEKKARDLKQTLEDEREMYQTEKRRSVKSQEKLRSLLGTQESTGSARDLEQECEPKRPQIKRRSRSFKFVNKLLK